MNDRRWYSLSFVSRRENSRDEDDDDDDDDVGEDNEAKIA